MLEEYDGIVYVSDMDSHELLYINKIGREFFHVDEDALSRRPRCYEVLQGRDAPCPFCTNTYLNESGFYEWEFYNPCLQRTLLLKDRKVRWNGRNARIEFATDVSGYRRAIAGHERQRDSILQSLPGGIRVESRPEEGSRFIVSLPLRLAKENAAAAGTACEQAVLVLVADQEENLRACRLLESLGLRAVPAHSAVEARERISAARARSEHVAAALLDQCLADGDEAASPQALRALCGEQPLRVILVREALYTDGDSLRDGVDAFLDRPLFRSTLRRTLLPGAAEGPESVLSAPNVDLADKRILLAEDNEINREIVISLLEMKGASVDAAEDGRRALEMFCASAPDTYDLILMDIQMPRLNGYEAAAAIRARDRADARRVPILALTADAFPEDALLARRYGMNEHISKPVAAEQLYQAVRRWLL